MKSSIFLPEYHESEDGQMRDTPVSGHGARVSSMGPPSFEVPPNVEAKLNAPASFRLFLIHPTYRYCKIILHCSFILIGGKALANAVDKL